MFSARRFCVSFVGGAVLVAVACCASLVPWRCGVVFGVVAGAAWGLSVVRVLRLLRLGRVPACGASVAASVLVSACALPVGVSLLFVPVGFGGLFFCARQPEKSCHAL